MIFIQAVPLWRPLQNLTYYTRSKLSVGDLVRAPLGNKSVPACVVALEGVKKGGLKEIEGIIAPQIFPPSLIKLCYHLADEHLGFPGEALGLALPRDIVRPPRTYPPPPQDFEILKDRQLRMRVDERKILDNIRRSSRPSLLHSSADFTALIVKMVRDVIEADKQVLLLFPHEPGLARFYERMQSYLPLNLYHAGLGQGERRRIWHLLSKGRGLVVAGMRSAALLPFTKPGLYIVFEADSQSHRVRSHHLHYNSREVVLFRGKLEKVKVILFSISPVLETAYAAQSGRLDWIERRVSQRGRALIVDLGKEPRGSLLSSPLRSELRAVRDSSMQVLLLLNRLGMAARLLCLDCGNVIKCEQCGIPLRLIKPGRPLECRICKETIPPPQECPVCKGSHWESLSPGLSTLKKELLNLFTSRELCEVTGERRPLLVDISSARVIFGTSAALEYQPPRVRLAAMLSWDAERSRADFRSAERAFRDVVYLRRILSSAPESRLVVQTYRPKDRILEWALKNDYESFFKSEVRRRRELGYPPYRRLLLYIKGSKAWCEDKFTQKISRDGVELLGPYQGSKGTSILAKLRRDLAPSDLLDAEVLRKSGWFVEADPVEIL